MPYEADAPLVAHDEKLADDLLFDLRLNHVWRRIVGGVLAHRMERIVWAGTPAEIEQANNWYSDMIADFYDESIGGGDVAYVGVKVGRTTDFVAPVAGASLPFEVVLEGGNHDTDDFWDISTPTLLKIPSGLDGYYHCYARVRWLAGVTNCVVRILASTAGMVAGSHVLNEEMMSMFCAGTAYLTAGQEITLAVRGQTVARTIKAGLFLGYGAVLGIYRVGI